MFAANENQTKAAVSVAEMASMVGSVTGEILPVGRHDVPVAGL